MMRRETVLGGIVVAAAVLAQPAAAQPPVFVELAPGDLLFHGLVRAAAEERLAAVLAETTGAWDFEPAAGSADFPRVEVALDERDGSWFYVVRFLAEPGDPAPEWSATFYDKAEADLRGFPAPGRLPGEIAGRFGALLRGGIVDGAPKLGWAAKDDENEGILFRALRGGAPVAHGAHLPADDLESAAIRLSFDERRALARSAFKIEAAHGAERVVEIFAEGSGACREWPDPPPPERAIKVALSEIKEPGSARRPVVAADVVGLAAGPVLLARYVEGGVLSCGEGPTPIVIGEELP